MRKRIALVAFLFLSQLFLVSCGQVQPSPKIKDSIVIAVQGEPSTLDSQYADDGNMRAVTDNVFERLLELDGSTLQLVGGLATEWRSLDENTWELNLRKGVKFHNGGDFSALDAVFSIKRAIDPSFNSQIAGYYASIKDAKVKGPYRIHVITDGPDPILPRRLTRLDIINQEYTQDNQELVKNHPVGTGPYKVLTWNRGKEILMEAYGDYWGKKPSINKVKYLFIREASSRLAALKAGEIDFAVNMLPEYVKDIPQAKTETGSEIYWLRFNQLKGPMVKKEMRLAANYAIDRKALADNLFLHQAVPTRGQLAKLGYLGYNQELGPYNYNKEKAQTLLKEAGYKGEEIELVSQRGRWLKDMEVTEAVAAMLTDAGFNIRIKFLSWEDWLKTLFNRDIAPDMQFSSSSNELFDMDRTFSSIVHSSGSQSVLANKEIDERIVAARKEMDPLKRQFMYEKLAVYFFADPFGAPLLNVKDIYGMAENLAWKPRKDSRITIHEMEFLPSGGK